MLDWSKYKIIDSELYSPREFSIQFLSVIAWLTITCVFLYFKNIERFIVEALVLTSVVAIRASAYIYDFVKYGRYGIPLAEVLDKSIIVRDNGRFFKKEYIVNPEDDVSVVGKEDRRMIRITRPDGKSIDLKFMWTYQNAITFFIQDCFSKTRAVISNRYPIEPS